MNAKIIYYVIGTIDVCSDSRFEGSKIADVLPDFLNLKNGSKRVFKQTEGSDQAEYPVTKHRKYVGILTSEQLKDIQEDNDIQTCKTMGSLTDIGFMDAISWDLDINDLYHNDCSCNLYVSPIINDESLGEIDSILKLLPEGEREIKIKNIQNELYRALDILEELEEPINEIEIDLLQCELELF